MVLRLQIPEDIKAAMRAGDARRRDAIRLLQAEIRRREVDGRIELDDAGIIAVIDKMLKQRQDSISQYEAAGRTDLAEVEKFEVGVLQAYMPQALGDTEIAAEVAAAISASGASGPQDIGKVMAIIKPRLAGRADMGKVSALVKTTLSA